MQLTTWCTLLELKRVDDPVSYFDGTRMFVGRLCPRGHAKAKLHVDAWLTDAGHPFRIVLTHLRNSLPQIEVMTGKHSEGLYH